MPPMPEVFALSARGLSVGYSGRRVIENADLDIRANALTALIGPNGSGKSTLLRALANLLRPSAGTIALHGAPIGTYARREFAKHLSFLPQSPKAPDGMSVRDLVRQGRYPHRTVFTRWNHADEAACERALALTGLRDLTDRMLDTLSGGQRQRVWIAMILAQEAGVMLLDEPATYLDIAHQLDLLSLLRSLARNEGKAVVAILHDLNHALRFADDLVIVSDGTVELTRARNDDAWTGSIAKAFSIHARIVRDPTDGTRIIVPTRSLATPLMENE